jgi:hypothetical protein
MALDWILSDMKYFKLSAMEMYEQQRRTATPPV